MIDAPGSKI